MLFIDPDSVINFLQQFPENFFQLKDLKGKNIMLYFWDSKCSSCVAETSKLIEYYNKYKNKNFEIVGVSLEDNKETFLNYLKVNNIEWTQYFDGEGWNGKFVMRFNIQYIPYYMFFDKNGINIDFGLESQIKSILNLV
jgi:thiol-disulfide isomerase/thioredoxin